MNVWITVVVSIVSFCYAVTTDVRLLIIHVRWRSYDRTLWRLFIWSVWGTCRRNISLGKCAIMPACCCLDYNDISGHIARRLHTSERPTSAGTGGGSGVTNCFIFTIYSWTSSDAGEPSINQNGCSGLDYYRSLFTCHKVYKLMSYPGFHNHIKITNYTLQIIDLFRKCSI